MIEPNTDEAKEEQFRRRMANSKQLMNLLDGASRQIDETGGIPHDEFWKQIDAKYEKKTNGRQQRKMRK